MGIILTFLALHVCKKSCYSAFSASKYFVTNLILQSAIPEVWNDFDS